MRPPLSTRQEEPRIEQREGAYFKDQRLVGGSWCIQALRVAEGPLVFKHRPREGELPRPVRTPAPREVILLTEASDGKVTGRGLQLLDLNAPGPRRHGDYRIVF